VAKLKVKTVDQVLFDVSRISALQLFTSVTD